MRSYDTETGWRAYQRFLPEDLRIDPRSPPREEWWAWRGLDVHLDRYEADGPLKVIVLHGGGGYGRLLAPFAVAARRAGHEAGAPDLPGYGLTRAPARAIDWALWLDCVADLVRAELERDGRPVVLFGGSIGGILAWHAAARERAVAGVVATMLLDPREPESRRAMGNPRMPGWGAGLLTRLPAALAGIRIPMRLAGDVMAIANDLELARLCAQDPLGGGNRVPIGFLRSLLLAEPPLEPEQFDMCPVLVVHPGADRWTPLEHTRRLFDRLVAPKELVVLENAGHFPVEEPGLTQMREAVRRFLAARAREVSRSSGPAPHRPGAAAR